MRFLPIFLLLVACAPTLPLKQSQRLLVSGVEVNAKSYQQLFVAPMAKDKMGIVLFDVNWDQVDQCANYPAAALQSFGFDQLRGANFVGDNASADLLAEAPADAKMDSGFLSYAYLLRAGHYALSSYQIKVARSASDIGLLSTRRSGLITAGAAVGGSFTLNPGEVVYIGNFFLDCDQTPKLWRYYTEQANFASHFEQFQAKYPFLTTAPTYRLFATQHLGK